MWDVLMNSYLVIAGSGVVSLVCLLSLTVCREFDGSVFPVPTAGIKCD